jgi:CBS domain-containing protein
MSELTKFEEVAVRVDKGEQPQVTVRELLRWFGAERRGVHIVNNIRKLLRKRKLRTEPDFEEVWIDAEVRFEKVDGAVPSVSVEPGVESGVDSIPQSDRTPPSVAETVHSSLPAERPAKPAADPVQRIGRLPAANRAVYSVTPGTPLVAVATQMMLKDYSQIPIIQGRDCRGAVTWQSIAKNTALGRSGTTVNDCAEPVEIVRAEASVLDVIPKIVRTGFVLIQARDTIFQGIVTTADLSEQFRLLSEPFILLGQIENHLRIVIQRTASLEEMREAKHHGDAAREVQDVDDLTLGEYVRLLEPTAMWPRLTFAFDRGAFLGDLKEIHRIRNDVMHCDPDGVGERELAALRNFAQFLEEVVDT